MILFFNSCQKVIEFNGEITDPLVVVNSLLTPDSVVSAQVSLSRFFLSNDTLYQKIDSAQVLLFVNGTLKEGLNYHYNGVYVGKYKPLIGDSLNLQVIIPGKKTVKTGTSIKSAISIQSIDTSSHATGKKMPILSNKVISPTKILLDTLGYAFEYKLSCVLHLIDDGIETNYYRLSVVTKTSLGTKKSYNYLFNFDDVVSGNTNNSIGPPTSLTNNKFNIFSNEMFFGKEYALKFSVLYNKSILLPAYNKYLNLQDVTFNLQKINQSYYQYLKTRANIKTNSFFAEPVQVYSNVDGGIGIMGSYSNSVLKINL